MLAFLAATCSNGVPSLRHDWLWPVDNLDFLHTFVLTTSGWNPSGFGIPQPYPSGYVLAVPITAAGLLLGGFGAFAIFAASIACLVLYGADVLARALAGRTTTGVERAALGALALLNPWVYTEMVAGHSSMILSYAGAMLLIGAIVRGERRWWPQALAVALVLSQLQFAVLALGCLGMVAVRVRSARIAFALLLVLMLPIITGVAATRSFLSETPLTLPWELSQSIEPGKVFFLNGYFTNYAMAFSGWGEIPVGIAIAVALTAARSGLQGRRTLILVAVCLATAAVVTGLRGPLAPIMAGAYRGFVPFGLFRELYTLSGLIVVSYVGLCSIAIAGRKAATAALAAAGIGLALIWLVAMPSRLWVAGETLPRVQLPESGAGRFALIPAFQPMSYLGKGDGADPDTVRWAGSQWCLNDYSARYPADAALARYLERGDTRSLAALSVSTAVSRPFVTDVASLRAATSFLYRAPGEPSASWVHIADATPLVSQFAGLPPVVSFGNRLGVGSISFSDAAATDGEEVPSWWRSLPKISPVRAPRDAIDPRSGWVDVRLGFFANPRDGQGLGGVVTTSREPIVVPIQREVLARITGEIVDGQGRLIGRSSPEYQWLKLDPSSGGTLVCHGRCVVVGTADVPDVPMWASRRPARALGFWSPVPWLYVANLIPASLSTLRLNNRYDGNWQAFIGFRRLTHTRLDQVANGWLVPAATQSRQVILVNVVAAVQSVLEIAAVGVLLSIAAGSFLRRRRPNAEET